MSVNDVAGKMRRRALGGGAAGGAAVVGRALQLDPGLTALGFSD